MCCSMLWQMTGTTDAKYHWCVSSTQLKSCAALFILHSTFSMQLCELFICFWIYYFACSCFRCCSVVLSTAKYTCLDFFCQERLLQMKRNLPSMSALTNEEMGLEDEADTAAVSSESKSKQVKPKATPKKLRWDDGLVLCAWTACYVLCIFTFRWLLIHSVISPFLRQ